MPKFQSDIDNSAILYLALIRKDHTNVYRFTLTMSEQVDAALLQRAVDRVHDRFPSIFAGFRPGFFRYTQVHSARPPQVQEDPGCLITMTGEEIAQCAYRVYYRENRIIIEAFHALTDGYGAAASFSTLAAEYLSLRYGIHVPYGYPVMDSHGEASVEELEDAYLKYADAKPLHLPSRYSYQLPGKEASHRLVLESPVTLPLSDLLNAAKKRGVSVTALLSAILAYSIMEIQQQSSPKKQRPVRIMVPVDLRRIFPSATLRNFILYALPTMEPKDCRLSLEALAAKFSRQIKDHLEKENLAGIMAYNVKNPEFFPLPAASFQTKMFSHACCLPLLRRKQLQHHFYKSGQSYAAGGNAALCEVPQRNTDPPGPFSLQLQYDQLQRTISVHYLPVPGRIRTGRHFLRETAQHSLWR